MWSREILKSNAKIALTGRYWRAFVVALLVSLLSGLANLGNTLSRLADTYESFWGIWGAHDLENFSTHVHFMNWLDAWAVALALFGFLLAVFVYNVFQVGQARYFVQNHFGGTSIETLFSGFRSGYGNTVAAMVVTSLYVFFWSLLLLIPGIYKSYQYFMVPYILSDNPHIP